MRLQIKTKKKTTAVQPTKSSSDDDSGVRHSFGANTSLLLTQSMPTVSYNTTRHCHVMGMLDQDVATS